MIIVKKEFKFIENQLNDTIYYIDKVEQNHNSWDMYIQRENMRFKSKRYIKEIEILITNMITYGRKWFDEMYFEEQPIKKSSTMDEYDKIINEDIIKFRYYLINELAPYDGTERHKILNKMLIQYNIHFSDYNLG